MIFGNVWVQSIYNQVKDETAQDSRFCLLYNPVCLSKFDKLVRQS